MQTSRELGIRPTLSLSERQLARKVLSETKTEGTARKRTDFCLEEFCAREEVWVNFDKHGLVAWYDSKSECDIVPIWPCQASAEASRKSTSDEAVPVPIDDFIDEILASLSEDDFSVSIFPVAGIDFEIMSAEELLGAIASKWATFAKSLR